jgi:hypothetical protein
MTRRQFAVNLTAFSLRWMSIVHFIGSGSRAKAVEHAPMIASAMEIRCFIILETSDAREASNVTWKFSIRTRRFSSRDDFFI